MSRFRPACRVLFTPPIPKCSPHSYYFCLSDDSLKADKRPTWMQSNVINVQDNPVDSPRQLPLRKDRHLYQPEPNTSLRNEDIGNDQISTPFSFFPPLQAFSFPAFWQPLSGTGNYRLLVNRLVRLEEEIKHLKQKIGSLDSLLSCVNIKSSANCAGLRPTAVSASAYVPISSGEVFPFIPSHSASGEGSVSSGVVVSSTYNRPAGSDGHGTVTVQHFGNKPKV
jgi:hypothetical protein